MSFESEILIARLRARGSRLAIPVILLVLASFLASLLTDRFETDWGNTAVYVGCALLAFFGFVIPWLRYLTSWTDITNSRIIHRSGLFGSHFQAVALADIERVELGSNRTITLFIAGTDAMQLTGLPRTRMVAEEISRLVQRRTGK